jgi:hypothetical protein
MSDWILVFWDPVCQAYMQTTSEGMGMWPIPLVPTEAQVRMIGNAGECLVGLHVMHVPEEGL